MDVYKIYTNTRNHVARGSLSDSYYKNANSRRSRLCFLTGWFRERTAPKIENVPKHCCARNDKFECYFGVLESNAHPDFEVYIWLKNVRIIFAKYDNNKSYTRWRYWMCKRTWTKDSAFPPELKFNGNDVMTKTEIRHLVDLRFLNSLLFTLVARQHTGACSCVSRQHTSHQSRRSCRPQQWN